MFLDKILATGSGVVGIAVVGIIGHVPLLILVGVDAVVIAAGGVAYKLNEWEEEAKIIEKRERDSNQNVSPLELRVDALESRDKKKDSEIQAMKQEIEQLKNNDKLAEQSALASRRRSVRGFFPPSSEPSNDSDIFSQVDGKLSMSGKKE